LICEIFSSERNCVQICNCRFSKLLSAGVQRKCCCFRLRGNTDSTSLMKRIQNFFQKSTKQRLAIIELIQNCIFLIRFDSMFFTAVILFSSAICPPLSTVLFYRSYQCYHYVIQLCAFSEFTALLFELPFALMKAYCYLAEMSVSFSKFYNSCAKTFINTLASGQNGIKKKHRNARGFAQELLRSCTGYGPGRSVKRRRKTSRVLLKNFLLEGCGFFVSDVISGGLLGHLGPLYLALGANR